MIMDTAVKELTSSAAASPAAWFGKLTSYERLRTLPVKVGNIVIGGNAPIRIQSMVTAAPDNVPALVAEVVQLAEAGAELVRLTVPSLNAVQALEKVKVQLETRGIKVPLVADVHFTPNAALAAASIVEKVRINPGNYVDKKRFATVTLDEAAYQAELERIEEKLVPLLDVCKRHQTALRIGVNHGSLSDRIVTRYGDSPAGMVQAALEFLDIAERHDFTQIVFSMKSSNPVTMTHAYRLLVHDMKARGKVYPLHLGVTEAGDGLLGRMKSAVGMAALLNDGIGDTIRVSLTEAAINELPVCKTLRTLSERLLAAPLPQVEHEAAVETAAARHFNAYQFKQRTSIQCADMGGEQLPKVWLAPAFAVRAPAVCSAAELETQLLQLTKLGFLKRSKLDKWETREGAPDTLVLSSAAGMTAVPPQLHTVIPAAAGITAFTAAGNVESTRDHEQKTSTAQTLLHNSLAAYHIMRTQYEKLAEPNNVAKYLAAAAHIVPVQLSELSFLRQLTKERPHYFVNVCWLLNPQSEHYVLESRLLVLLLMDITLTEQAFVQIVNAENPRSDDALKETSPRRPVPRHLGELPILLQAPAWTAAERDKETQALFLAFKLGPLFVDGLVNGIYLKEGDGAAVETSLAILQAARRRMSKVDYISCPSCGRTLFDLQEVTAKLKARTAHLKNVKIGIMGCIVNGPGEMADADFGYVGSGVGKVTLYKGREIVRRNVAETEAVAAFVDVLREYGVWHEPREFQS